MRKWYGRNLKYFSNIWVIDESHGGYFSLQLFHHVVAEDMFAVEDFDGNVVAVVDISGELHLRKASFSNGFSQLVFPNHDTTFCYLQTHFSFFLCSFLIRFLIWYICVYMKLLHV
ncbi:hypothetical protein V8G54_008569 [Vigna mungo]|uniref:Uncharacterized protein n=1 Tax=Vigna mungo TaxID=3915 RepID=A0AAQ3P5Z3_VIGMU